MLYDTAYHYCSWLWHGDVSGLQSGLHVQHISSSICYSLIVSSNEQIQSPILRFWDYSYGAMKHSWFGRNIHADFPPSSSLIALDFMPRSISCQPLLLESGYFIFTVHDEENNMRLSKVQEEMMQSEDRIMTKCTRLLPEWLSIVFNTRNLSRGSLLESDKIYIPT